MWHPGIIQRGRQHSEVQYRLWLISNSRIFLRLKGAVLPVWFTITDIWIENPDNACKGGAATATEKQGGPSSHLCAKKAPPFWHHEIWGKQVTLQMFSKALKAACEWEALPLTFSNSPNQGSCSLIKSSLHPPLCAAGGSREELPLKGKQAATVQEIATSVPRLFKTKNKTWKSSWQQPRQREYGGQPRPVTQPALQKQKREK